ncbi:cytochrome P450 [Micromonospora sp. NPDC048999]|uniref:cytochrome P450 n=1 Tax=Micromonospora sp. NPDC048999 TaxID=3155391 RepID=UPI0033C08FD5
MSEATVIAGRAGSVSLRRALPRLVRDPLGALVHFGNQSGGGIVRLNLGTFRPYLVTHPEHLQQILRDRTNFIRDGESMLWRSVRRAVGDAILVTEGELWESSRDTLQPLFTAKRAELLVDRMAVAIAEAVEALDEPARTGQAVDAVTLMSQIVCRATTRVLFGKKIPVPDALQIFAHLGTITRTMVSRLLAPGVPYWIPLPGDRAFRKAVEGIDALVLPIIRKERANPGDGDDIIATLCRPRADGSQASEEQIRSDVVAMFSTANETTIGVLSWLWPVLEAHPEVADRLYAEIDEVVGRGPVQRAHIAEMRYSRMVLDEMLRLWPAGWTIPRTAVGEQVLGGVRIEAGATILVSPYATQRMEAFWDRPGVFDPERFSPDRPKRQYRYSYFPFGGGPHQCIGQHLFLLEAPIIVATLLSRYRFRLGQPADLTPRLGASLRPRPNTLTLLPRESSSVS